MYSHIHNMAIHIYIYIYMAIHNMAIYIYSINKLCYENKQFFFILRILNIYQFFFK